MFTTDHKDRHNPYGTFLTQRRYYCHSVNHANLKLVVIPLSRITWTYLDWIRNQKDEQDNNKLATMQSVAITKHVLYLQADEYTLKNAKDYGFIISADYSR